LITFSGLHRQERAAEGERVGARITVISLLLLASFLARLVRICVVPSWSELAGASR